IAEKTLAAQFNRPGHRIVDHRTFVIVGDGCLMEGISHEAASLAGRLGLGKLVAIYDDNGISIDGKVERVVSGRHVEAVRSVWLARASGRRRARPDGDRCRTNGRSGRRRATESPLL